MLEITIASSVTCWYILCGVGFSKVISTTELRINGGIPVFFSVFAWPVLLVICSLVKENE